MTKVTFPDLDPVAQLLRELEDQVSHVRALMHPMYPDNNQESRPCDQDDLNAAAKNMAILGARVQGRIGVLLHKVTTANLQPVPEPAKRDVWCNRHHQLDDC